MALRRFGLVFALGPFFYLRRGPAGAILLILAIVLLTLVTQVGGLFLWLCLPFLDFVTRIIPGTRVLRLVVAACMVVPAYFVATVSVFPMIAGTFGRAPLACGMIGEASYAPLTAWTCLLNRHYATPGARLALERISAGMTGQYPGTRVAYLDASFPFGGGFPMLPHLSHGDGRKIDFAFVYNGPSPARARSPIGYWGYEQPRPGDPRPCEGASSRLRWDFDWLQALLPAMELDDERTAALLSGFADAPEVRRILLESHLKSRLGLDRPKIRFQGCGAARHDDHFHVAFR